MNRFMCKVNSSLKNEAMNCIENIEKAEQMAVSQAYELENICKLNIIHTADEMHDGKLLVNEKEFKDINKTINEQLQILWSNYKKLEELGLVKIIKEDSECKSKSSSEN